LRAARRAGSKTEEEDGRCECRGCFDDSHGLILNERVYKFVLRFESGSESGGLAFEFYRFEVYEYGF